MSSLETNFALRDAKKEAEIAKLFADGDIRQKRFNQLNDDHLLKISEMEKQLHFCDFKMQQLMSNLQEQTKNLEASETKVRKLDRELAKLRTVVDSFKIIDQATEETNQQMFIIDDTSVDENSSENVIIEDSVNLKNEIQKLQISNRIFQREIKRQAKLKSEVCNERDDSNKRCATWIKKYERLKLRWDAAMIRENQDIPRLVFDSEKFSKESESQIDNGVRNVDRHISGVEIRKNGIADNFVHRGKNASASFLKNQKVVLDDIQKGNTNEAITKRRKL